MRATRPRAAPPPLLPLSLPLTLDYCSALPPTQLAPIPSSLEPHLHGAAGPHVGHVAVEAAFFPESSRISVVVIITTNVVSSTRIKMRMKLVMFSNDNDANVFLGPR